MSKGSQINENKIQHGGLDGKHEFISGYQIDSCKATSLNEITEPAKHSAEHLWNKIRSQPLQNETMLLKLT